MFNFRLFSKHLRGFLVLCALWPLSAVGGDEICSPGQQGCVAVGQWEFKLGVGLGFRNNPLVDGEDFPLFVIPDISYYGDRFFLDTYIGGFTFVETESSMINGVITISSDQLHFATRSLGNLTLLSGPIYYEASNQDDAEVQSDGENVVVDVEYTQDGTWTDIETNEEVDTNRSIVLSRLHSRDTALLSGLEFAYFPGGWDVSLHLLQDVSKVHDGHEVRFAVSRFLALGEERFEMATGFNWQDRKTLDYYWGVDESEVDNPLLAYHPSSSTSPFFRIDWRRKFIGNWSLQSTIHHRWLSTEVADSPLVEDNTVLTVFVGGVYHF